MNKKCSHCKEAFRQSEIWHIEGVYYCDGCKEGFTVVLRDD